MFVGVGVCVRACARACVCECRLQVEVREQTGGIQFSPATLWDPGIQLRLTGLHAGASHLHNSFSFLNHFVFAPSSQIPHNELR